MHFAERIISEYPEIDMRLFYENCKRLALEYEPYGYLGSEEEPRSAISICDHTGYHNCTDKSIAGALHTAHSCCESCSKFGKFLRGDIVLLILDSAVLQ